MWLGINDLSNCAPIADWAVPGKVMPGQGRRLRRDWVAHTWRVFAMCALRGGSARLAHIAKSAMYAPPSGAGQQDSELADGLGLIVTATRCRGGPEMVSLRNRGRRYLVFVIALGLLGSLLPTLGAA